MNKNLIIRADANPQTGTGHVMRCIALAQAWQDRGGKVIFLSHCENEVLRQRIIDEGFEFLPIEKPHPDPHDLKQLFKELETRNSKLETWLVLDGYHFTPLYQKAIRDNGYKLLVIDDMAHLNYYHADILLNQNIHASSLFYSYDKDTVKLMGSKYVLLRKEFLHYKSWKREIPDKAKRILVTMGGSDPDNVTLKVIMALDRLNDRELEIIIVAGPVNLNIDSLKSTLPSSTCPMCICRNAENMPEIMAWADMAVTAAGSTCWELAFMGVPSITVVTGENQQGVAKGLEMANIYKTLGWHNEMSKDILATELTTHIQSKKLREKISRLGRQLIDGKGARNVVYALSQIGCREEAKMMSNIQNER